jgi:hypothetical protein
MQTFYKIRHKKTARWSKGGVYVPGNGHGSLWVEQGGKAWDTLGKLRAHITSHMGKYTNATDMSDWEVVEFQCTIKEVKDIHEMIDPKKLMAMIKNA